MKAPLLSLCTPIETGRLLGQRVRALRLLRNWKRDTLAQRAGVSPSSLKRFESSGKASLGLVLKVALALGVLGDFQKILLPPPARSMEELERQATEVVRKRGRS